VLTLVNRVGIVLSRSVDGEADQRLVAGVDEVMLASLRNDNHVTSVDLLLFTWNNGFALSLSKDQVLVDVVNLGGKRIYDLAHQLKV
jgi:hypothetical protein